MPKTKTAAKSHNADFPFRKPYPIKKPDNNPKSPPTPAARTQNVFENVLKTYVESHKKSLQNVKQTHLAIIRKAQEKTKAICEKDEECSHLIRELHTSQGEVTKLLLTIEELKKNDGILQQDLQDVNAKFTKLEKNYDNQINSTNTIISVQKSNLDEQDMRIAGQQTEITNLQKINQILNDQIKTDTEDYKNQISNLETELAHLQEQNRGLQTSQDEVKKLLLTIEEFKKNEDILQQNFEDLNAKFTKLEKIYDNDINSTNTIISVQKLNLDEQDMRIAEQQTEITNLQKINQILNDQIKTDTEAYKNQISNLETEWTHLQEQNRHLLSDIESLTQEVNEQVANQKNLEETVYQHKVEMEEHISEFTKSNKLQLNEAKSNIDLLQKTLGDKVAEIQILLAANEELTKNLKAVTEKSELNSKAHIVDMERLYKHNENVTNSYMADEKRYQFEIETLKVEMDRKTDEQQDEMKMLQMKIEELKTSNDDLLMSKENAIIELADEKVKYKELELKMNLFQEKLNDLQNNLNNKNQELEQLERAKNAAIAELKYKMAKIGNVFNQSVGSAAVFLETNETKSIGSNQHFNKPSKSNEVEILSSVTIVPEETLPSETDPKPSGSSHGQRAIGRKMKSYDISDFYDDSSEEEYKSERLSKHARIKRPIQNRSGNAAIKQLDQAPPFDKDNIFDKLKTGGI